MRRIVLATVLFFPASFAFAADMALPGYSLPIRSSESFSHWYLRGDIGYSMPVNARLQVLRTFAGTIEEYTSDRIAKSGTFGGGVGVHLAPWLRVDATIEMRAKSRVTGQYSSIGNPAVSREDTRADLSATTGLINVYADLGRWSGLSPYIGAGIGASHLSFDNYSGIYTITPAAPGWGTGICPPVGPGQNETCASPSTPGGVKKTGFTYAFMAGVGVDLTPGLKLDFGYRYINYGTATMTPDPFGIAIRLKDAKAHEVRFGLRYYFGGLGTEVVTAKN